MARYLGIHDACVSTMPGYPRCLVIHDTHATGVSTMWDIRDIYDVDIAASGIPRQYPGIVDIAAGISKMIPGMR
jgi:hypothetical protein